MSKYNQHREETCLYDLEAIRNKAQQCGADEIVTTIRKQVFMLDGREFTDEAKALKTAISIIKKGGKKK